MVTIDWIDDDEAIITHTFKKKKWLGKEVVKVKRYRGSCTVWHDMGIGVIVGTLKSVWLNGIWTKAKWAKDDALKAVKDGQ